METFKHIEEPYGYAIFTVESVEPVVVPEKRTQSNDWIFRRAEAGWVRLRGTVVEGRVTSRLFQHKHTEITNGQRYSLEVPPEDYERGYRRTIAM